MHLLRLLRWPLWFLEIFTTAKSFTANPIIGNPALNRLGLHLARVRLAHAMTAWRRLFIAPLVPADLKRQYREQGYIAIENFLDPQEFAALRAEIIAFDGELRRMIQGDTITFQGLLDDDTVARMPAAARLLGARRFRNIMMYGGASFKLPMFFAHCVRNGVEAGAPGCSATASTAPPSL